MFLPGAPSLWCLSGGLGQGASCLECSSSIQWPLTVSERAKTSSPSVSAESQRLLSPSVSTRLGTTNLDPCHNMKAAITKKKYAWRRIYAGFPSFFRLSLSGFYCTVRSTPNPLATEVLLQVTPVSQQHHVLATGIPRPFLSKLRGEL